MSAILGILLIFVVILAGLLGRAIGSGFLLHGLIAGLDLGMAVLIGLFAAAGSIYFYSRRMSLISAAEGPAGEPVVIDARPSSPFYPWAPLPTRRGRRRKSGS